MPDVLIDGGFYAPTAVGARRYEYPFRNNGDRVSALFDEDYWQRTDTFVPHPQPIPHDQLRDFYLVKESDPVEFMGGLFKFTRTYARVPSQQTEYSSILITMPEPSAASGAEATFGVAAQNNPTDVQNALNGGIMTANWFYGRGTGAYYRPLQNANAVSYAGVNGMTVQVTNHGFTNGKDLVLVEGNINGAPRAYLYYANLLGANGPVAGWYVINANYIHTYDASNRVGLVTFAGTPNNASFGKGSRYVRCKRITDYYLPGVTSGITTPADIPLPADQSGSASFIDALLAGTGTVNYQVGEVSRWRDSLIHYITKTTIEVVDLV